MKASILIRSASAALVIGAIVVAGIGCSKKAPQGSQQAQQSEQARQTLQKGKVNGSLESATQGSVAAVPARSHVGNTPAREVASATGKADLVKPLVPPSGVTSQIAALVAPAGGAPAEPAKLEPPKPEPQCFKANFRHDKVASHSSDEICSQHQNLLVLKHKEVNVDSLCVRVNGRPVRFERVKGHPEQVIIGAVAGPKAEIIASYCVGKTRCQEDCKIPKDEFLDAIGGGEEVGQHLGKWLETDQDSGAAVAAQMDSELKKELAELEDKGELYRGWNGDSEARECVHRGIAADVAPKGQKAAALKR